MSLRLFLRNVLLASAILFGAATAGAHEVRHAIEVTGAIAVRLSYADGKPFAFEAFEAHPEGSDTPARVGRTDAQGRAVFIPGDVARWRLKAYSGDGHGVDIRFTVPAVAPVAVATPAEGAGPGRASRLLFGLALLLGAFGIYQLWLRKRR